MRIIVLLLLGLLLAAATNPPSAQTAYVMRHLHTPAGERDPDLTDEGRAAAERLANFDLPTRLVAIYVSNWKRTQQTAATLAARLGLTPIVYEAADVAGMVERVRREPGPVLIVGHSNTVPVIVEALGGQRPADITHDQFGDIWMIHPEGRTEHRRLP